MEPKDYHRICVPDETMSKSDTCPRLRIRDAARSRHPLDGPDAQALEGALSQVEEELAAKDAELAELHGKHLVHVVGLESDNLKLEEALEQSRAQVARLRAGIRKVIEEDIGDRTKGKPCAHGKYS